MFNCPPQAEYVRDNRLGGIMFWSIDNDDFRGRCSGQPYPLIEAAKEAYLAPAPGYVMDLELRNFVTNRFIDPITVFWWNLFKENQR